MTNKGQQDAYFRPPENYGGTRVVHGQTETRKSLTVGGGRIKQQIFTPNFSVWKDFPHQICPPPPLCDIPSRCCFIMGPWTVTRSSLRMLRRVAAFCWTLRPVLLLVSFLRSWSPVVGVLGLCWMWHGVPFALQWRPVVGVSRLCWLPPGSFDCVCCQRASVHRLSVACLAVFLCA